MKRAEMYESPIKLIAGDIQQKAEQTVVNIVQSYGFQVDRNELYKALKYDRDQYDKGYKEGYADAILEMRKMLDALGKEE